MNNSFSFKRVFKLFKYDWVINKKQLILFITLPPLITLAYCIGVALNLISGSYDNAETVTDIFNVFIFTEFSLFCLTKMIKQNINKDSALTYALLPASNLEKVIYIHLRILTAIIIISIMNILNKYILYSALPFLSSFQYVYPAPFDLTELILTLIMATPVFFIMYFMYINACMLFKKNNLIKGISLNFICVFLYFIYAGLLMNSMIRASLINNIDLNSDISDNDIIFLIKGLYLILTPAIILLCCGFYNKIKEREIR